MIKVEAIVLSTGEQISEDAYLKCDLIVDTAGNIIKFRYGPDTTAIVEKITNKINECSSKLDSFNILKNNQIFLLEKRIQLLTKLIESHKDMQRLKAEAIQNIISLNTLSDIKIKSIENVINSFRCIGV